MKRQLSLCTIISMLMISVPQVNAATVESAAMPSGALNITGKILDKGCNFEAKDVVIQLKPVVITSFTAVGDMSPKSDAVPFKLTGCPANSTMTFTVQGTVGTSAALFAVAKESTNSASFDIVLYGLTSTSAIIRPNTALKLTTDASGNYSGVLAAQMRANVAAPVAGKVDTTLTYSLVYN
ncbi:fimbrial protein [Enterobacter roggenkampii]